jgi:hypothetical protein
MFMQLRILHRGVSARFFLATLSEALRSIGLTWRFDLLVHAVGDKQRVFEHSGRVGLEASVGEALWKIDRYEKIEQQIDKQTERRVLLEREHLGIVHNHVLHNFLSCHAKPPAVKCILTSTDKQIMLISVSIKKAGEQGYDVHNM